MASQSSPPPNPSDDKPQNPVTEVVQPANQTQQDAKVSPPSVFVNSEPMREDQVQNAVKFLSHPRVRGSPVMYRRSFLEKKGLTKEEIDEAFRRVPDPTPSAQATNTNQEGQVTSTPSVQQPATSQALQPAAAPPGGVSSVGTLARSRFHWYHAVFAVGILAVSGAGTAKTIIPRLKSWIRKVVAEEEEDLANQTTKKPNLAEETAAAAKAAAAAAADVAKASQEMLNSKNEGQTGSLVTTSLIDQEGRRAIVSNTKCNTRISWTVSSSVPSSSGEPSAAPHPKSYMEIMEMVQRGEKPSNIRDINDQPPNPNRQITNPRLAPRAKPWEVAQDQNGSSQVLQSQGSGERLTYKVQDNGVNYQLDGASTMPWGQQQNAKITEIENEDEIRAGPYGRPANERPVQRSWVPPQPPPVVMPEAAEAIRRPKPSVQKEQLADNESLAPPADATSELQKITNLSESEGTVEIKGLESGMNSSEILSLEEQG
ncbi:hypothetical protein Tsubulata_030984 [Turnera subulata]|uniref:Peroxisomal membrane protein PEX14 n=1 Tax=Turnera subulata TaxID=218843 RepID=A0A9Q0FCQ2_9ROSI|nr:hypothetical protein Tsubulata_030984 [Turnera subulata]